MSEVKRFSANAWYDKDTGEWVKYEDYETLRAENERLRAALKSIDRVRCDEPGCTTYATLSGFKDPNSPAMWVKCQEHAPRQYTTLTTLTEADVRRIVREEMASLYASMPARMSESDRGSGVAGT